VNKPGENRSSRLLPYEFGALILLGGLAAALTATVLEIQMSATAYIAGESHWSKGQQDAAYSLYRYVSNQAPEELQLTRDSLAIPLGDRAARLALEHAPVDKAAARAGFLRGNNAPEDVDRLVRTYRYFRDAPYFRDSVAYWREGDTGVLELTQLADEIEARLARGSMTGDAVIDYQQRILAIDARLRHIKLAFSRSLVEGARVLNTALTMLGIIVFMIVAWSTILVLRSTLRRIRESEGVFRAAFHQAAVGMLKMDRDGTILEANETIGEILDYSPGHLREMRLLDILHPSDMIALDPDHRDVIDWTQQSTPTEHRFVRSDGSTRWVRWTTSVIEAGVRRGDRVFAIVEDVSEARQLAGEMAHQASHDALTGLINRREIEARLKQGLATARRLGVRHAFFFVDLDQFKLINDTCGHIAGDQLLRQLAGVLLLHLRGSDWLGRLGGDEFAVLLERTTLDEATHIAQRVSKALCESIFLWEGRKFNVTCSIGIVEVSGDEQDVTSVLRAADRACYLAKEDGRNCIRIYEESDQAIARRRDEMAWVGGIRKAIDDGRILLYAQRIQSLDGSAGLRYEVLVRLVDGSGKICTPDVFLPAAEHYGEAMGLDRVVASMVLKQLAANPRHLRELELCHINVSAQSIANPEFRAHVAGLLDLGQVPARKLCFELTETAAIGNLAQARAFIDEMRSRGCKIALDDFGSGLSSFAYLKNLPVDILKIDGVFVRDLIRNDIDPVLVRSMCEVARFLGKITIAEWVESDRVLARLRELGVDQAQGFAIHEPCPLLDLIEQTQRAPVLVAG
jgi:diguanylate cyclase (GGDEF)-like protein/PAS domain S-box-containing protein